MAMSNLTTLETVLTWEGSIDNERIRQLLDVKTVWASRLLSELSQKLGRRARRASAHAPLELHDARLIRRSPDEYLRAIGGRTEQSLCMIEDARIDLSPVDPGVFSAVFRAIKRGVGVQVTYRSMTSPLGQDRVIYPHSFVRAPRRWHVRAWCSYRKDYRDFTLGRIASAKLLEEPSSQPANEDERWQRILELLIVAHPGLTSDQQDMIAQEYFPGTQAMRLRVRECLAAYAVQDLRLALNPSQQKPPDYQLLVSNTEDLPLLFAPKGE